MTHKNYASDLYQTHTKGAGSLNGTRYMLYNRVEGNESYSTKLTYILKVNGLYKTYSGVHDCTL